MIPLNEQIPPHFADLLDKELERMHYLIRNRAEGKNSENFDFAVSKISAIYDAFFTPRYIIPETSKVYL